MRSAGNSGRRKGPPGDLYVNCNVAPHPNGLVREGSTVFSNVSIGVADAILGCKREVETVRGAVDCCIAQLAIDHDLLLIHRNHDFETIAQIRPLRQLWLTD